MNPEPLVSHTSTTSFNTELTLLPENVRANPHMFCGWREGLLWALVNLRLLEQFKSETGADIDIGRGGIGSFISPEHGFMLVDLGAFVDWYNRSIWRGGE